MKVLIIEDEHTASENLKYHLNNIEPSITIETTLETVADAVSYFNNEFFAELVFVDIHLADGISFEIFEKTEVNIPIIFTTAYNEYAIKAFKVNSIDYLLKPIDEDELREAINKYKSLKLKYPINDQFQQLLKLINRKSFKSTYLVQQRDTLLPLEINGIAYFTIDAGVVKAITLDNKSFVLDKKLEEIELEINPEQFFRANRQFIVQRNTIENLKMYFNGKLILNIYPKPKEQIIISKAKAPQLKNWINNGAF
ncbi:LytTR family DNA-binding domain-containing protein [Mariniflexile litorale]|uniref:LytTR family DNA-binding domain-containing protein n=1 Tax=Mariniflexile litorale TaxID=3045158 RepID=A0AAU7EH88_9FLAO|nr:LytTR family DNA-binding domain-containing protein [Mariniflexile sp. KMM 9835]MDQ8212009.1 LytTR family DNA-binding domain-containing protein [Mariniflexile sp. KMM 9835]